MKRPLLPLSLALALLGPPGPLAKAFSTAKHECTDHVCACARAAKKQCHESEASAGLQASCNHDSAAAAAGLPMPAVLALPVSLDVSPRAERSRPAPREGGQPGFPRIDSPPPRGC